MIYPAQLFSKKNGAFICHLCWNRCRLEEGEIGICKARVNKDGSLYTLTYGNISAMESRPIEVKPFFHFKPSSTTMTFSTYSCNFTCPWCQNWHLSRTPPPESYRVVKPSEVVEAAIKSGDEGLCASFNEPTLLFEYLLDLFPLAKQKGLYNTMVSNGYLTPKALEMLRNAGLDAINIDIKGNDDVYNKYCVKEGKASFVWTTVRKAVKLGIHIEIINLVITGVNDSEDAILEVIENHLKYAGENIPIHFTRYFPAFEFMNPPTKIEKLEKAVEMARREGVEFAYVGNIPGHRYENTYCPQCGELLISRMSYRVLVNRIKDGKCNNCGKEIYGVW